MNILIVGAHYDDFEIGCGGTIYKYLQKEDVNLYVAITSSDEFRTGDPSIRYVEQCNSFKVLGKNIYLYQYSYKDEAHNIIGELDKTNPDIIFTHYEKDTHQDHRRASIIGQAVGRKRHITTVFFDSGSTYDFHPNLFSFIDIKKKTELLYCFKTQVEVGAISMDITERKNSYWASLVSHARNTYAEGFVVRKMEWKV